MPEFDRFVPITTARATLSKIVRQVQPDDSSAAVTENGVPAVVILSASRYAGLLETLDVLSDEETMKALRRSILQAKEGMGGIRRGL